MSLEDKGAQHQMAVVDKYHAPSADYQMTTRDYVLRVVADTVAVTITLPPVAEAKGRFYSIKCRDASFAVTIQDKDDSEDWNGDIVMAIAGCHELLYSDGMKWMNILFPFDKTITGEGWSLNRLAVVSTATVGEGTRGLRINMTTSPGIASGDLQCFHGYLTLGLAASVANGAAISPLSGWIEIPDTTTFGATGVVCGARIIFDAQNNALGKGNAGIESALIYAQTWAGTGTIDAGLRIAAGVGTTIDSLVEWSGLGTQLGTVLDFTSGWGLNTPMQLVVGGPSSDVTMHFQIAIGVQANDADITAEIGAASDGSAYFSTSGALFIRVAGVWTAL